MIGERDSQLKRAGRALEAREKALADARQALVALKQQQTQPGPVTPGLSLFHFVDGDYCTSFGCSPNKSCSHLRLSSYRQHHGYGCKFAGHVDRTNLISLGHGELGSVWEVSRAPCMPL